jgi:HEPN domain-containing protein
MENQYDTRQWLREAEGAFNRAFRMAEYQDWVGLCQQAQLCVEYSAKAVIDCFEVHEWTAVHEVTAERSEHNHGEQLLKVLQANEQTIRSRFGEEMIQRLQVLAADADAAAPWHGWSTYGRREPGGRITFPTDLCTQEEAERLLERAERSFPPAVQFIANWLAH